MTRFGGRAHYLAAQAIVKELEETWHVNLGKLPNIGRDTRDKDPNTVLNYKKILRAWESWARETPRTSTHFFNADRNYWPKKRPKLDSASDTADSSSSATNFSRTEDRARAEGSAPDSATGVG